MAGQKTFKKVLIANRGEIACRVMLTAKIMGLKTIAVYSDADITALHTLLADEAYPIGPAPSAESYLKADAILKVAKEADVDAIHPGYGFLAENAEFASSCQKAGITFIGPSPKSIRAMGSKEEAKRLMEKAGVPVVPGYHGNAQDDKTLKSEAKKTGYPILIKAVAGGGGKGMRKVETEKDFSEALKSAKREGKSAFGNDKVLIEKFIEKPRHIEVQVFGDSKGNVIHLFERDCSIQRRHQKIIEEAPAPGMPERLRDKICAAAVRAVKSIGYENAGTIEFIVDASKPLHADTGFYFMEMNTRLQVEHPVTEMITGLDLVEWQIRVARGEALPLSQKDIKMEGHAIEARLYAEDPKADFLPQTGRLVWWRHPEEDENFRFESGFGLEDEVTVYYDPMLAKIVTWGITRDDARARMVEVIDRTQVAGVKTNLRLLRDLVTHPAFVEAKLDTGFIDAHPQVLEGKHGRPFAQLLPLAVAGFLAERQFVESLADETADAFSPWGHYGGWRMNHGFHEKLALSHDGAIHHLDISRVLDLNIFDIRHEDGSRYKIQIIDYGPPSLEVCLLGDEETTLVVTVIQEADIIYLLEQGTTEAFEIISPFSEMEAEMQGPGTVTAPMPGRILEVLAKKGQKVKKDTRLVVMEAMKMENTLKAPRDGVIKTLDVTAGQQVNEGDTLFEIDGQ